MTTFHPQPDEHGAPVRLAHPSTPTATATWDDRASIATVIPLGALPPSLNDVPFAPWLGIPASTADWQTVLVWPSSTSRPLSCQRGLRLPRTW